MKTLRAECIHPGGAVLGEGPVWHAGHLWWVDIDRCEVHRFDPITRTDHRWTLPNRVGFVVPSVRGDFIVGTQRGIGRFDPATGTLGPMINPEQDKPDNRFNDAKCDPQGRLWAGTMAIGEQTQQGALYCVDAGWRIRRRVDHVSVSNGLAWSPDGRTMYYVDSLTKQVDAFDFDTEQGEISKRRTVITLTDGYPDGMCADEVGNLWIAIWGGWCVACHDPRTGECLAKIDVPVKDVTSCCFGGDRMDELYITTASRDVDAAGRPGQPEAGGLFLVRPGLAGRCTNLYAG